VIATDAAAPDHYLTTEALAAQMGVSPPTVRKLIRDEGLPAHQIGRRWVFVPAEVDQWLRNRDGHTAAPSTPDSAWLAEQLARFTADDLRRVGEVLAAVAAGAQRGQGGAA
jgi:excisionase family DNA binding protein